MDIEQKLRKLGVNPSRGQNFLGNSKLIKALVNSAEIQEDHRVLEIGGGTGEITSRILDEKVELTVVENDTKLAEFLEEEFDGAEVLNTDFLDMENLDFDRCISNLPFQITSEAIENLGRAQIFSSLIVQEQLAEKATASPGDSGYNHFSVLCQYYFVPVKLMDISSSSFHPQPEVEASILKLYPNNARHNIDDEELFFQVSRALFTHRNKKVRNSVVDARNILNMEKDHLKEVRDDLPHSEKRVRELSIRDITEISSEIVIQ